MDAEDLELHGLYASLGSLGARAAEAESLAPGLRDLPPLPGPAELPVDARLARRLAASLSGARAQADALARAEARLDGELVRRVFALATKVIRAGGEVQDKDSLAAAMRSFGSAVAALREQQEPPHGARAIPSVAGTGPPAALSGLAPRSEVDAGVARAASLLETIREMSVRRAEEVAGRLDGARDAAEALSFSRPDWMPAPGEDIGADDLSRRVDALEGRARAVARPDEVAAARDAIDDTMLSLGVHYKPLEDGVFALKARIRAAERSAGGVTSN